MKVCNYKGKKLSQALSLEIWGYDPKMALNDWKWAQQRGYSHITRKRLYGFFLFLAWSYGRISEEKWPSQIFQKNSGFLNFGPDDPLWTEKWKFSKHRHSTPCLNRLISRIMRKKQIWFILDLVAEIWVQIANFGPKYLFLDPKIEIMPISSYDPEIR